jgi:phosphate transport system substrate-binding protein
MLSLKNKLSWLIPSTAIALAAILTSCAPSTPGNGGGTVSISGAGASAPNSLYQRWFSDYRKVKPNVEVSYQSIGSGAGINQFLAQTVDFGATDDPITGKDAAKFPKERGKMIQVLLRGFSLFLPIILKVLKG